MVQDIMKTGQLIHFINPVRYAEYKQKNLMPRIRLTRSHQQNEESEKAGEPTRQDVEQLT